MSRDIAPATLPSAPRSEPPPRPGRGRFVLAGALGVMGALAISYTVGRVEASDRAQQRAEAIQARAEKAAAKHEELASTLKTRLNTQRTRVTLLEARRRIHMSLMALGDRNFGIARDELRRAAALIHELPGPPDEFLTALADELSAYETVVTENLGDQRSDLLAFAQQLDLAIDAPGGATTRAPHPPPAAPPRPAKTARPRSPGASSE